jgi:hypothetical protein
MTLIDIIRWTVAWVIFMLVCFVLETFMGRTSLLIGAPLLLVAIILLVVARRRAQKNWLPRCHSGRCGPDDYEGLPLKAGDCGMTFRCHCSQDYRLQGKRFMILQVDGMERRFKIKNHWYSPWVDDLENQRP